mmetsp:Transcript_2537/g.3733  ORF Transcript_2537/g.3733 Transcript_2537/m.3733 type:complete len:482 (-) Transcript_2537:56-1501(-)
MLAPNASTIGLARKILKVGSATRSEVSDLLVRLTNTLRAESKDHIQKSMVPRIPKIYVNDRKASLESIIKSISDPVTAHILPMTGQSGISAANSTYGETPPDTVQTLLAELASSHNHGGPNNGHDFSGDFVDAGSGNGIMTICAADSQRFELCRGIEYDRRRHEAAMLLKTAYANRSEHKSSSGKGRVEFSCGDIKNETFAGASVVFSNSVVWDADLCGFMGQRMEEAELLPPRLVITLSRRFPSPSFNLVDILTLPCNGRMNFSFYVCQKANTSDKDGQVQNNSFALSDSPSVRGLRNEGLLADLAIVSLKQGNEGMAFLASVAASEPSTRALLENVDVLAFLAQSLRMENDITTRASSTLVLRAMSNFPVGRRNIAESAEAIGNLCGSLGNGNQNNDHPAIRGNVIDILGQVFNDPMGNEVLESQGIDLILDDVRKDAESNGWHNVIEACHEAQTMRRWWGGEQRTIGNQLHWNVLRAD